MLLLQNQTAKSCVSPSAFSPASLVQMTEDVKVEHQFNTSQWGQSGSSPETEFLEIAHATPVEIPLTCFKWKKPVMHIWGLGQS